jgi:hypothetical protein
MRRNIVSKGCRITAVDNAKAMVDRCRSIVAGDAGTAGGAIEVLQAHISDVDI